MEQQQQHPNSLVFPGLKRPARPPHDHGMHTGAPLPPLQSLPVRVPAQNLSAAATPIATTPLVPAQAHAVQSAPPHATHPGNLIAPRRSATKSRLRWENIFPALSIVAALVTAWFVVHQWDEIRGDRAAERDRAAVAARTGASISEPSGGSAGTELSAEALSARVAKAQKLIAAGRYEEADMILRPLSNYISRDPRISGLQIRLERNERTNARLVAQLNRQLAAERWSSVLTTLRSIKKLHPLTRQQRTAERRARTALAQERATRPRQPTNPPSQPPSGGAAQPPTSNGPATAPPAVGGGGGSMPTPPPGNNPTGGSVGNPAGAAP